MKPEFKLYYSIGEASKILEISTSKIRFWEKEFKILNIKKDKKGNRRFTKNDLKKLKLINHLLKEKKYTISGAKKKIQNNYETRKKSRSNWEFKKTKSRVNWNKETLEKLIYIFH